MLWSKNMWKGYDNHIIWKAPLWILVVAIVLAAWMILAKKIGDWIAYAFRGMFL